MPTYDASISIEAPPESVWRVLAAVAAWPEWLPTVSSVQPLDGDPLRIGAPIGWLFRATTERYLAQEAASLKLRVEGQQ